MIRPKGMDFLKLAARVANLTPSLVSQDGGGAMAFKVDSTNCMTVGDLLKALQGVDPNTPVGHRFSGQSPDLAKVHTAGVTDDGVLVLESDSVDSLLRYEDYDDE